MDIKAIKKNYEKGMIGWTKEFIAKMVVKGIITADEYKEITGEQYA